MRKISQLLLVFLKSCEYEETFMRATGALGKRFGDPWFKASVLNCTSNLDVTKIISFQEEEEDKVHHPYISHYI